MAWKPPYITPAQLAKVVRADAVADVLDLTDACEAASRVIDKAAGRQFGRTAGAETRFYEPIWSPTKDMWKVITDDFLTLTSVAWDSANDGTYATPAVLSNLILYPRNAPQEGKPYEGFYIRRLTLARVAEFQVIANPWGWAAVPGVVPMATKLQASRIFARRDAPFGVAGSPNDGSETRLLAKADPDVVVMLRDVARRTWAT